MATLAEGTTWPDFIRHRRGVLQKLRAEQSRAATEANFWAVDIFDRDPWDLTTLTILRSNNGDVYEKEADGYNLLGALQARREIQDSERNTWLKPARFGKWIQDRYGIQSSHAHNVLSVVASSFWMDRWGRCAETAYGEAVFNCMSAEDIINVKSDKFLGRGLDHMFKLRMAVFAKRVSRVGSRDWEVIMDFNRRSNNMNTLRLHFYPTPEDNNNGDRVGKYLRLDSKWLSIWSLPQLESPRVLGSKPCPTRRPGFLARLSDIEYHACFDSLAGSSTLKFPTWKDFLQLCKDVAHPTKKVLQHTVWWTNIRRE
ncbi:hypothetical protein BDV38DRAFT_277467 [Aspergillus pseudotamarii]|uniref:Uncharacterized protein n=1 Tax=Aspergillus pseudotamarii TaxID=132259 RepID=A0A5N6TB03_ASPPS|nr:uncharacterized protein BDV38DRAFT_277467 [Aspergillus pseudotamarii]KAE8143447.1 hypothetical protein BDV38DRAFT_277467 [Aspergillus pseudotamarii]